MNLKCIACGLLALAVGCGQETQQTKTIPMKDQPRPSGTAAQIIEDMTGKTDVKAGQRAAATIHRVNEQETKDLDEVMK